MEEFAEILKSIFCLRITHGGWPGHVIKDIQNCCAGAKFLPDMKIQFDSQGGANMLTSQADINAWIERVKKAILSGGKAYEIQNTSENR